MQKQITTFYLDGLYYGIDVMSIQEVTKEVPITKVLRSQKQVSGLINLRGRVAMAVELGFVVSETYKRPGEFMTIVCEYEGSLYSFLVDTVGDVISFEQSAQGRVPETTDGGMKNIVSGVFQTEKGLLRIIEVKNIIKTLEGTTQGEAA